MDILNSGAKWIWAAGSKTCATRFPDLYTGTGYYCFGQGIRQGTCTLWRHSSAVG